MYSIVIFSQASIYWIGVNSVHGDWYIETIALVICSGNAYYCISYRCNVSES